jgi:hypothetical protein
MWICSQARAGTHPHPISPLSPTERAILLHHYQRSSPSPPNHPHQLARLLNTIRNKNLWIMCDCCGPNPINAPVMFPRRMDDAIRLVRNRHRPPHAEDCPFAFDLPEITEHPVDPLAGNPLLRPLDDVLLLQPPRPAAPPSETTAADDHRHTPLPRIAKLLWTVMERAGVTTIPSPALDAPKPTISSEMVRLREALAAIPAYRAHGQTVPFRDMTCTYPADLVKPPQGASKIFQTFHRHRAALEATGRRPQAYFIGYIPDVHGSALEHDALPENFSLGIPVRKLSIFGQPVSGPYLVIAAYAQQAETRRFGAMQAFAQPIYDSGALTLFTPVSSPGERLCLRMLKSLQYVFCTHWPNTRATITKPLFPIMTELGLCLPDFVLETSDPTGRTRRFAIEYLGSDDPDYRARKIASHRRTEQIGPLFTVEPPDVALGAYKRTRDNLIESIVAHFRAH